MEPTWIRPADLRLMCLVGIIVLAWGAVGEPKRITMMASGPPPYPGPPPSPPGF